jgi:isopenicillin N synthase-like dioxygenase
MAGVQGGRQIVLGGSAILVRPAPTEPTRESGPRVGMAKEKTEKAQQNQNFQSHITLMQTIKHDDNDPGRQRRPRKAGPLLASKNISSMQQVVLQRNKNNTYTYYF